MAIAREQDGDEQWIIFRIFFLLLLFSSDKGIVPKNDTIWRKMCLEAFVREGRFSVS
jgi:hypothetical protein